MVLKSLKNKILGHAPKDKSGEGLYATLDELIAQRQYISYLKNFHQRLKVSNQAGDVKSAFKGRGIELEELRSYSYGDDVRDIDWRVTARKQTPFTRVYAEEKDREVYVLLDLSPYMAFGTKKELKSVAAAKLAALVGWLCMENRDRFGALIFDGSNLTFFKPSSNRALMPVVLKKISQVSQAILTAAQQPQYLLDKALKMMQSSLKNPASIFIISDFSYFSESVQLSLSQLARKSRVCCLEVSDVLEFSPPPAGEYMIADANGKNLIFNTSNKLFRSEYQEYFYSRRNVVKDFCRRFRAFYMSVRTDVDLYKQLKFY